MNDKKLNIGGIIFLLWFICSIIGVIYFSKIDKTYCIMVFGQIFFVFGVATFFKKNGKIIGLILSLTGLGCAVIPYLMKNPEKLSFYVEWDYVIVLLLLLLLNICCVILLICFIKKLTRLKNVCTLTVSATIIKHDYKRENEKILYCPIYSFEFNNQKYEVKNNHYSNFGIKPVGTVLDIKINPNNPNEFFDGGNLYKVGIIISILSLIALIPALIYVLTNYNYTMLIVYPLFKVMI